MHKAWTELRTIQIHHQPAHGLGPFPPSTSQPQVRLASSTSRQRGATQHPPWTPLFPPRPNPTQMLQNTHVVHKCAKSSHSTVESDCKKTWFLGHPSFTHNYCRSRIITVVHARFTLFHAVSRTPVLDVSSCGKSAVLCTNSFGAWNIGAKLLKGLTPGQVLHHLHEMILSTTTG